MAIPIINEQKAFEKIIEPRNHPSEEYYAFYSSWFGGIVKNPGLMLIPMDDHLVHRGDGVFEAMKAVKRAVYLLDEHLQRLFNSADKITLKPLFNLEQMKEIILETVRVANHDDVGVRVFLSRGPGNFSVNPYDAIGSQLYVVITRLTAPAIEKYEQGVVIGKSHIPVKPSWVAQIKSCNYLPNVLMKKEAVDRHLDFVIGVDSEGSITEGPTENILIVDQNGVIVHPELDYILKGTTMVRACELARENGIETAIRPISIADVQSAREVMMTGTSLNVLPVVKFEDGNIGNGKPGIISRKLNELLLKDIEKGNRRTLF